MTASGSCPTTFLSLETINTNCREGMDDAVVGVTQDQLDVYIFGQTFSTLFQQSFMLVLILGRWLLPKGGMTRDELSQLLLVYVAMAADMLEFSIETLRLPEIACERTIFIAILAVWSWSLLQFSFGQVVAKKRSRRLISLVVDREDGDRSPVGCAAYLFGSESWALLTDVLLQDAPYLAIRTYIIIQYTVTDNILIFFAVKNLLLVVVQFYRLTVLIIETGDEARRRLGATEELGLSVLRALQNAGEPAGMQSTTTGINNDGFEQNQEDIV